MIQEIKNKLTIMRGAAGAVMSVTFPQLNSLGTVIQLAGGLLGLILLIVSIQHMSLQKRIANMKIDEMTTRMTRRSMKNGHKSSDTIPTTKTIKK